MRTGLGLAVSLLSLVVACGSSSDESTSAPTTAPSSTEPAPLTPWPTVLEVDKVEVLQGTTTLLVDEGVRKKKQNAPIIAGRPGFVRIHARLTASTIANPLKPVLTVSIPGKDDQTFEDGTKRLAEYDPTDLDSTFTFDLPDTAFDTAARYKLTLTDSKDASKTFTYPTDGQGLDFGAQDAPTLRVQFIPVKYGPLNRMPTLDDKTVAQYKQSLYKMYPVSKVEVSLHAELDWPQVVEGDGTGWDQLLSAVMTTRRHDPVTDDVYYVGVFEPSDSLMTYCKAGCVMGVAPAPTAVNEIGMRSALIIGYGGDGRNGTLAQELAHAMGRLHAPCGNAQFIDTDYPYDNAHLGVTGFDIIDKKTFDPGSRTYDFMSYCGPVWTSDYTYKAIFDRMVEVKQEMGTGPSSDAQSHHTEQSWYVDAKGALTRGPEVTVKKTHAFTPGVTVHTSQGDLQGVYHPYSSIPGGILVTPKVSANVLSARAEGLAAFRGR